MDIFGSDDEDDIVVKSSENCDDSIYLQSLSQLLFIEAVKFKPFLKRTTHQDDFSDEVLRTEIILNRRISIVSTTQQAIGESLRARLHHVKFQHINLVASETDLSFTQFVDFIAICEGNQAKIATGLQYAEKCLLPGGICVLHHIASIEFEVSIWIDESSKTVDQDSNDYIQIMVLRKRSIDCNTMAATYWSLSDESVAHERYLLEQITVPLSIAERSMSILSDASHSKAVEALRTYGVVVFKGLVKVETVLGWGRAATADMHHVIQKLLERDIDMLEPREGQWISNYHEMSMREAFRCDLRNGVAMKRMHQDINFLPLEKHIAEYLDNSIPTSTGNSLSQWSQLRESNIVSEVLLEVMNPPGADAKGNWGRYNFEEGGPEIGPPPLKIGQLGCVMSVPGCIDQTIHADAPHLFVHTQLPGHYYNLFMPALETETQCSHFVGQTAYIAGSHILKTCADMMIREGGQQLLERNLLRPHIYTGDALIFDTRILHMGLSNNGHEHPTMQAISSKSNEAQRAWRPMMYVNYHQKWFHDPKNWNDAERLF